MSTSFLALLQDLPVCHPESSRLSIDSAIVGLQLSNRNRRLHSTWTPSSFPKDLQSVDASARFISISVSTVRSTSASTPSASSSPISSSLADTAFSLFPPLTLKQLLGVHRSRQIVRKASWNLKSEPSRATTSATICLQPLICHLLVSPVVFYTRLSIHDDPLATSSRPTSSARRNQKITMLLLQIHAHD
jgi:hypothetical protein